MGSPKRVGPIIAAIVLTFATEALAGVRGMEEARFIIVVVGMVLILRCGPGGLSRLVAGLKAR